jgi:hypothetical protein
MVPVESARAVAAAFGDARKENLTVREYPGLDHRWAGADGNGHFAEVMGDILGWAVKAGFAAP